MKLATISLGCFLAAISLALVGPSTFAQSGGARVPLGVSEVAETLRAAGLDVAGEQIDMPMFVTTATRGAKLRLSSADLLTGGSLRIRVICEQASECLPFFATLHGLEDAAAAFTKLESVVVRASPPATPSPLLQAGQHVTLLIEDSQMRITLPVIAIDSGRPGTDIRVSSLDRKHIFHGVVADAHVVRGNLQ